MPRWKAAVLVGEKAEAEEKAAEAEKADREGTYEVLASEVPVRSGPDLSSDALLTLGKGERVTGTVAEIGGALWLKLAKRTAESHPESERLEEAAGAWVLVSAPGAEGQQPLARAPAELGWQPAEKQGRSEVFEVVAKGGLSVEVDLASGKKSMEFLEFGSLIKVVKRDAEQRLSYELLTGGGPAEGWISAANQGSSNLLSTRVGLHVTGAAPARPGARGPAQDGARAAEAMQLYAKNFMKKDGAQQTCIFSHEVSFSWRCEANTDAEADEPGETADDKVRKQLERDLATASSTTAEVLSDDSESDEDDFFRLVHAPCIKCKLPLGSCVYQRPGEEHAMHGECIAEALLQEFRDEEKEIQEMMAKKKNKRREEYGIGWTASRVPINSGPALKITGRLAPHGLCALSLASDNRVKIVPTTSPTAAVNLEYLSIALKVRREEDREPLFSLDPVDNSTANSMQVKRFEPHWLKSTSVGDVMFEADYHLKELSMGEYNQPVVGMMSCMDAQDFKYGGEWTAREWFVVRKAEVVMSQDGVLLPQCKMGVEAREEVLSEDGKMEDMRVTRPDHPLVKYAESFTHYFDLIAERKSVIYHLRELAKASILAKYLLSSTANLDALWFDLYETNDQPCLLEIPQLWNERGFKDIQVNDGMLIDGHGERDARGIYGGVQFGIDRFRMGPSAGIQAARYGPGAALSARRGFMPPSRVALVRGLQRGAFPGGPRGVDLGLGRFELKETRVATHVEALAFGEDAAGCVSLGGGFWEQLDGGANDSVFSKDQRDLLTRIFDPCLSDRRSEGELFTPPAGEFGYCSKLRSLLKEEQEARRKRKDHFFDKKFSMARPGPLFPCSWENDFQMKNLKALPQLTGQWKARPDYMAQANQIQQVLRFTPPAFEKSTEDGLVFRIYRLGSLEVRTTQEFQGSEEVGAIFSRCDSKEDNSTKKRGRVLSTDRVKKATEYVEYNFERVGRSRIQFYVVIETEEGNTIVSESRRDGQATWQENPVDLEVRNSLAKVLSTADSVRTEEGKYVTLNDVRPLQAENGGGAWQTYPERFFLRAVGHLDTMAGPPPALQESAVMKRLQQAFNLDESTVQQLLEDCSSGVIRMAVGPEEC